MNNHITLDRPIGSTPCADGSLRTVFLDHDGRQFVLGNHGAPVFGIWLFVDDPQIVANRSVRLLSNTHSEITGPIRRRVSFRTAGRSLVSAPPVALGS
jgi:hypothetical protein